MTIVVSLLIVSGVQAHAVASPTNATKRPCGRVLFMSYIERSLSLRSARGSGGDLRKVADGDHPSFTVSPDGYSIVYEVYSDTEGDVDLWIVGSDGGGARPLTDTPSDDEYEVSWAPDSSAIAYSVRGTSGSTVRILDLTSGDTTIVAGGHSPDFSPSGDRLVYVAPSMTIGDLTDDLFIVDLAADTTTPVTDDPTSHDATPRWSPTGRWIAFNRYPLNQMNENEGPYSDIWKVKPDGVRASNLTNHQDDYNGVSTASWSPNGEFIAFNTEHDSGGALQIIRRDGRSVSGSITQSLHHPSRNATWSPKGNFVAFERFDGDNGGDIWRYDLRNGTKRNLTPTTRRQEFTPQWLGCG